MYFLPNNRQIDTDQVKIGLDDNSPEIYYWLNLKTGEVEIIVEDALDEEGEEFEEIYSNKDLVEIPKLESWQKYNWMEDFAEQVVKDKDKIIYEKLLIALDGKGAFSRFKNVLHQDEDLLQGWYDWQDQCLEQEMQQWFEGLEVEIKKDDKK